MNSKIKTVLLVMVIALFTMINVNNVDSNGSAFSNLVLENIDAEAHTIGCESSLGTPLYYCIDWSVVTICSCANSHSQHAKSYCSDRMC